VAGKNSYVSAEPAAFPDVWLNLKVGDAAAGEVVFQDAAHVMEPDEDETVVGEAACLTANSSTGHIGGRRPVKVNQSLILLFRRWESLLLS